MNNFSYTRENQYPSTPHTVTEDAVSVQGKQHTHTHTQTNNGPYSQKTSRTNVCKSFINPFLHKLSHKQYSEGISFLKDF